MVSPLGYALKQATIGGTRIAYVDEGRGPPLLLLHGMGGSHADWEEQIKSFVNVFRIIAPDLRGHGDSGMHGPFTVERLADDMAELVHQLNLGSYVLIGHSLGGAVAQQLGLLQADQIQKLVLSNTLPSLRIDSWKKRCQWLYRYALMRVLGANQLKVSIAKRMYPNPEQAELLAKVIARGGRTPKPVYLQLLKGVSNWSIRDRLAWLRMPVLVMASEHDYFPTIEAQHFAEALPKSMCRIVEGAHHGLPLEYPQEFNRAAMDFMLPGQTTQLVEKTDPALNWLRVDTKIHKKIDVQALVKRPNDGGR